MLNTGTGVTLVYIGKMSASFSFYFCNFCISILHNSCFLVVRRLYNFHDFVTIIGGKVEDANLLTTTTPSSKAKLTIKETAVIKSYGYIGP